MKPEPNDMKNYSGQVSLSGKKHGEGIDYDENGKKVYEGNFCEGIYHGFGIEYDINGMKLYEGEWQNGQWSGWGKDFDQNGNVSYEGEYVLAFNQVTLG